MMVGADPAVEMNRRHVKEDKRTALAAKRALLGVLARLLVDEPALSKRTVLGFSLQPFIAPVPVR